MTTERTSASRAKGLPPGDSDGQTLDSKRWRALSVCLLAAFMTLLDVSIVNVALPSMRTGLNASTGDLQWVVAGYALAFGLLLVPAGRLGDARGRKGAFLVGLALFTVFSVLSGLATGPVWLLVARFLQGASAGLLNPQIIGLIQQMFSGAERGRAFGLFGMTTGFSTAVGPVIGGLLINGFGTENGWRWTFFINLPIGVVTLVLARFLLPGATEHRKHSLDVPGVALLGVGVLAVLLPCVEVQQWHGPQKWWLLLLGAVALIGFVRWELRYRRAGHEPIVDMSLFQLPSFCFGTSLSTVYIAGFTGIFFIFSLFLQNGEGYSALAAGVASVPCALGTAVSAYFSGRLVSRFGGNLVIVGLLVVLLGLAGTFAAIDMHSGPDVGWWTALPLLVAGLGSGTVIAPNQTLTLSKVPVARAGSAGGVMQTGQRIGAAAGTAIAAAVFFASLSNDEGGYSTAFAAGLVAIIGLVAIGLVVAVTDRAAGRRAARSVTAAG